MSQPLSGPVVTRYPRTRQPLQLRRTTLPNRIVRAAQGTQLSREVVNEPMIRFHETRARGGVGLTILGDGRVHTSGQGLLHLWEDRVVDGLAELADRCRAAGMVLFQELTHQGGSVWHGVSPWAPSPTISPVTGLQATEMTQTMIDDVVAGFAASARQCVRAGIAGVEVHAAHGFLVGQFLSPLSNERSDNYGGSEENRSRFLIEVLRAVRDAVGPDAPVGVRLSSSERYPGGMRTDETSRVVRRLQELGLIDFLDLSLGAMQTWDQMIGPLSEPHCYQLPYSAPVAEAANVPTIVTGRVTSLAEAEAILESGVADLVSMLRATIADPGLVQKSWAGDEADVRPCIACNHCVRSIVVERRLNCAVNPQIGRDGLTPPAAAVRRRVLVVGGGPAGMECARLAAQRGHDVTLLDAADQLGGTVTAARSAPHREEFGAIVDWQQRQLRALPVRVELATAATLELIQSRQPDVVVVATGAAFDPVGAENPIPVPADRLCDVLAILNGRRPGPGEGAVVLDELGSYPAVAAAETLARAGHAVTIVTGFEQFGPALRETYELVPSLERLSALGVDVLTRARVTRVAAKLVTIEQPADDTLIQVDATLVCLAGARTPRAELVEQLQEWGGCQVEVIGDASGSQSLASAIAQGYELGATI